MKLVVITSVLHGLHNKKYYGYAPYVDEINIWSKYAAELIVVAPLTETTITAIDRFYDHKNIVFTKVSKFNTIDFFAIVRTLFVLPKNLYLIFRAMHSADHIHLRCPGNMGLLGCFVQILFPKKNKTAKYAGNWDPRIKKPWSYCLQQKLLSNTFLTKNMKVLVYGNWKDLSANCHSFFTATYFEAEKKSFVSKTLDSQIKFVFAGTLSAGKNPLYAIQLTEELAKQGFNVAISLYGAGSEQEHLEAYILKNNLCEFVSLKGNQERSVLQLAYQESHFVVLPSVSEGWPKAIAEGMFWGCVPLATAVSCVPDMLGFGQRGILLDKNIAIDASKIALLLRHKEGYNAMQKAAFSWSQNYTIDVFEAEIKKMLL